MEFYYWVYESGVDEFVQRGLLPLQHRAELQKVVEVGLAILRRATSLPFICDLLATDEAPRSFG